MSPGKALSIRGLGTVVPGFGLHDVSLEVPPGQCMVVLGPTGSGKSMLAETLCGLRQAATGRVSIGDRDVTALDPARRRIGYVPQDHGLLPFKNVQQNVVFALRAQQLPQREVQRRTADVLEMLGMAALAQRRVRELSGGERQRLALGRALAMRPELLLLDEPLASLDQRTAEQLIAELLRLRRGSGTTSLHICHSLDEALSLGDRLAVIHRGRIIQSGPPEELFTRPRNVFVARLLRLPTLVRGQVRGNGVGRRRFFLADQPMLSTDRPRGEAYAVIAPQQIGVSLDLPSPCDDQPVFCVRIAERPTALLRAELPVDGPLTMRIPGLYPSWPWAPGRTVYVRFPRDAVHLIDAPPDEQQRC